ncbi:hypothetical protein BDA96_10G148700 [Sorghum bicolor]|uniref:Uncharacterized protein n=1 Tax=Sorghum bicolor TaxID=4558 RepID=A0A921Q4A1_SORBI|nr:hypothetical protein BDA96_10G148700 [Sorghum bicolor]
MFAQRQGNDQRSAERHRGACRSCCIVRCRFGSTRAAQLPLSRSKPVAGTPAPPSMSTSGDHTGGAACRLLLRVVHIR